MYGPRVVVSGSGSESMAIHKAQYGSFKPASSRQFAETVVCIGLPVSSQ